MDLTTVKKELKNYTSFSGSYNINDFIMTEMVIFAVLKETPHKDVEQAYLLLCNYSVIGKINNSQSAAFLQKAHRRLRQYSSKRRWTIALERYCDAVFDDIRYYLIKEEVDEKGKRHLIAEKNPESVPAPDRTEAYLSDILNFSVSHDIIYAKKGKANYNNDSVLLTVDIPENITPENITVSKKGKRKEIKVTLDDLLEAGRRMNELDSLNHCYDTLKTNILKSVKSSHVLESEAMLINECINIVGMVGSGKSTMIKALSYHLANKGKKIVIVLDTVFDVMEMYGYFRKLKLKVSPLVGKKDRLKYINQVLKKNSMYLTAEFSEYLTAGCILDGISQNSESAPVFGNEPCKNLEQYKKRVCCPYFGVCPAARMQRDAEKSDIVVTTVAGFAASHIGLGSTPFFEYVLDNADLVIFDECDKVQRQLDGFFAPTASFSDFIVECSGACKRDMEKASELERKDMNIARYDELLHKSSVVCKIVLNAVNAQSVTWKTLMNDAFSGTILYDRLTTETEESGIPLPKKVKMCFEEAMYGAVEDDEFNNIFHLACFSCDDSDFDRSLRSWLKKNKYSPDMETLSHIKLFLVVARFDEYIRELEAAYCMLPDELRKDMELFGFLQSRFAAQQRILPSSVLGNILGMKNVRHKGLELYRQYAFGRATMTRLPWLRMSDNGESLGPHVILLSGSSWAKGCLDYHVNVPVSYVLEAEKWKREKLAGAEFIELGIKERVSGSSIENRRERLESVIKQCIPTILGRLNAEGKILMIVNSYDEAEYACNKLSGFLSDINAPAQAAFLIRSEDKDNEEKYLNSVERGTIVRFSEREEKILIAPAAAIERGYNIVESSGHSTFSSVFFLVRPMPFSDDITGKYSKLNGIVEGYFSLDDTTDMFKKSHEIRRYASVQWCMLERSVNKELKHLDDVLKKDVTASLFVLILQIYGRLARITEPDKPVPCIYFADGAFRSPDKPGGYDFLNQLIDYLDGMMNDPESGEIAKTLYQPFYEAFKRGVSKYEYNNFSDDYDSEEYYL